MQLEKKSAPTTATKKIGSNINKIIFILTAASAVVVPLLFLPITSNVFEFNKQIFIVAITLLMLVLWTLRMLTEKKVKVIRTSSDMAMLVFMLTNLAALILAPNRLVTAITPQTWVWIVLPLFYWVITNNIQTEKQLDIIETLVISIGGILALWSIVQYFLNLQISLAGMQTGRGFSPFGSPALLSIYLLTAGAMSLSKSLEEGKGTKEEGENKTKKASIKLAAFSFITILTLTAVFLISPWTTQIANSITGIEFPESAKLSLSTAWSVAIETIRNRPLAGVGIGLFDSAFGQYRPLEFNLTDNWAIKFNRSFNLWFQFLTEQGIVGFAGLAILIAGTVRLIWNIFNSQESARLEITSLAVGIIFLAASSLFTVWTTPVAFLFFLLLALQRKKMFLKKPNPEQEMQISILALPAMMFGQEGPDSGFSTRKEQGTEVLPKILVGPAVLLAVFGYYVLARAYLAEINYKNSLNATIRNKGVEAYDAQRQAINHNPFNINYRLSYSNLNYLIAVNISQRQDISEADRNTISNLIQQSLTQGRIATQIKPQTASVWSNIGGLYRNLINVAENAEQFALEYYQQAINRDPIDPNLRIAVGGVYYLAEQYQQAAQAFTTAANLKPDYPNAYYNLANALKKTGSTEAAIEAYKRTLVLLDQGTSDYEFVSKELQALQSGETEVPKPAETEEIELSGSEEERGLEGVEFEEEELAPEETEEATESAEVQ